MAQHFLLSSQARKLSLIKIARMNNQEALHMFKKIRWFENDGNPICPKCQEDSPYFIKTRKQFRCRKCFHSFSATSGTVFHAHKLPLQLILMSIAIFANAVKGISALQLSRDLDIQYKTAWLLLHKIRESLLEHQSNKKFKGICELDGVYVGGYIRPANNIEHRVDRRKIYKKKRRVILSLRERNPYGTGAHKTKTFILKSENAFDINRIARKYIGQDSEVHTDEGVGFSDLGAFYNHRIVNHSLEYSGINGENNNQSESYNARFRRMQIGQLHQVGTLYLSNYANKISYREDTRRFDNGFIFRDILRRCLKSEISNEFCGYHQGNRRVAERLGA